MIHATSYFSPSSLNLSTHSASIPERPSRVMEAKEARSSRCFHRSSSNAGVAIALTLAVLER
jgi:hypothetical protein